MHISIESWWIFQPRTWDVTAEFQPTADLLTQKISGTALIGMLRGGTCVHVCSDGRTKYTFYDDVPTGTGATERKHKFISDYILFGHMRNEDEPQMIMIFPSGNHDPPIEAANASNAISVKLYYGVPKVPYMAHAQAMCAIGSESKFAWKSLQKVTRIDNNEDEMRKVAMMAVASGSNSNGPYRENY